MDTGMPEAGTGAAGVPDAGTTGRGAMSALGCSLVIVVDDEVDIAQEIAEGLAADGVPSHVAASAEEALALLGDATPAGGIRVVVTDLRMPGVDGLALIRRLRPADGGPPAAEAVLMSGHASDAEQQAARQAGAAAVLNKPFAWYELMDAVAAAVATGRARRGLLA